MSETEVLKMPDGESEPIKSDDAGVVHQGEVAKMPNYDADGEIHSAAIRGVIAIMTQLDVNWLEGVVKMSRSDYSKRVAEVARVADMREMSKQLAPKRVSVARLEAILNLKKVLLSTDEELRQR